MFQDDRIKDDRRVFERFPASMPANLFDLDAGKELEVTTCDVSAKGVGILSEERLTPGDRLELWLKINDGQDPLYTRGNVMWATEEERGKYRVGISLEKSELMGMARILRS